ncbi:RelA/SpoT domain protein [Desulfamplus magnetovallimortis]|uniref:RelA/SpoT domain protein n=1 Tax=Desulfamplus magnetovallimortis TaxID=1246637 RepID=L0R516_9BACT|nr:RelA/SpoT domain-containing protein [Desulfamplus magnetovallimortis]CCO06615.1 RelA/SpoT domain protein [Desulfamplus magnetovallimortis BW-1]SLM32666.1 RelA/SpoT domain protein [Desulfamplus magnetovallimortis]
MVLSTPKYSKSQVNKAGEILIKDNPSMNEWMWAYDVLDNWRSCHGYPINTFQATLRNKLKAVDKDALVAQRLKRMPSIISKLKRFRSMKLARMQDIGGLRSVVSDMEKVRELEKNYRKSRFNHDLVSIKDYISNPKESGYRSIHLVYKYSNSKAPEYNGLHIELQIRSKLQHYWATAVETMGTFLEYALKSSEGPQEWLNFFSLTGCAFAYLENTPPVPGYKGKSREDIYSETLNEAERLCIYDRLQAFSIVAKRIRIEKKQGSYHLIILDLDQKIVSVQTYSRRYLETANREYAKYEKRISMGENLQVVLVSAGSVDNLRRAYPNYFLDTGEFINQLRKLDEISKS